MVAAPAAVAAMVRCVGLVPNGPGPWNIPFTSSSSCEQVAEAMEARGTRYLLVAPEHPEDDKIALLRACADAGGSLSPPSPIDQIEFGIAGVVDQQRMQETRRPGREDGGGFRLERKTCLIEIERFRSAHEPSGGGLYQDRIR